ncbi:MAG: NADPH-dependent glutamate synthase [Clostridiales bacterium]|nr:NADPH-dependent glutamate synthase [Candidatus Crickella caballi]
MPSQEPDVRNKNFDEVALGYTEEDALNEAARCLNCKNHPCVDGCPVNGRIPEFIAKVAEGKFEEAYEILTSTNSLPAICGRVCPQENQCEGNCVRGIKGEPVGVGRLERFVADRHKADVGNDSVEAVTEGPGRGIRVAIVGSGPAGLTCAGDLINLGYDVTVFEGLHKPGGVLVYGIPEFRLPKDEIVAYEVETLRKKGVKFVCDVLIGKSLYVQDLLDDGYKAVFIGTGAGLPMFMNIEGENLVGVYSANEYLTRINLMKAYLDEYDTPIKKHDKVVIVGAGNVAMDAARCAKRMGAEVHVVYRRGREEMPARAEEIEHAEEEGIEFHLLNNPVRILGDEKNRVSKIECIKMELGEPDASGRRRPVEIPGSEYTIDTDAVIMALGTKLNSLICNTTEGLEQTQKGGIQVDEETGATSIPGVYAGGDAVTGAATVIKAMGAGKKAAAAMHEYLQK